MWLIFGIQQFGGLNDECYGIVPLNPYGLKGIFLSPLFHADLKHILSNSVPFFVLTFLTFHFYDKLAYFVLFTGWISSGFIVWLLPDFEFLNSSILSCHIGASSLIYLLAFFLFFSGIFRKEKTLMAVSLLVVFLYGSIIWGVLPQEVFGGITEYKISWEGHLSGALMGLGEAFLLRKYRRKEISLTVENPNPYPYNYQFHYTDDELWQQYKEDFPDYFPEEKKENSEDLPQ